VHPPKLRVVAPLPGLTFAPIMRAVEAHYGLAPGSIVRGSRKVSFAHPRQLAMYLCRTMTEGSYPEIGRAFGGRNHATVIHAVKAVEARLTTDPDVLAAHNAIVEGLGR
jgi:chromosomal replication initiator protein